MDDDNAKVWSEAEDDIFAMPSLVERNTRGHVQFCTKNSLFISNTCFILYSRRLYTWKCLTYREGKIGWKQINYILLSHTFKKIVKSVKTYLCSHENFDHNLLYWPTHIFVPKILLILSIHCGLNKNSHFSISL